MKYAPNGPKAGSVYPLKENNAVCNDSEASQHFIHQHILKDIQSCIGDCADLTLPNGIKPHLEALVEASNTQFYTQHELAYWELYRETVELCRQGWHSFNYWISVEQSTCYRLYWDLKRIAEKYGKPLVITSKIAISPLRYWQIKGMSFLKKIARFCHIHEFEYYRSIVKKSRD